MIVTLTQRHNATVEQETLYAVNDDRMEEFQALPEGDREQWLWSRDNAAEMEDTTTIEEIHETESVEITW